MNEQMAKKLREPFDRKQIGKLPKPTKKDNPKGKCAECGGWHGLPAVHLDYVGHAATCDRLLSVDHSWTWEPMARDETGAPVLVQRPECFSDAFSKVGLWINLLIGDTVTPGFGEGKNIKEAIGDAIRNASMRRGVALDLWSKEDLHATDDHAPADAGAHKSAGTPSAGVTAGAATVGDQAAPASPFVFDKGAAASDAQKKKLYAMLAMLSKGDSPAISERQFVAAAHGLGVTGDDSHACIESLSKGAASNLIERLSKLEANQKAAA